MYNNPCYKMGPSTTIVCASFLQVFARTELFRIIQIVIFAGFLFKTKKKLVFMIKIIDFICNRLTLKINYWSTRPTQSHGRKDNCFRTCCPSVRPSPIFKSRKTKQQKTMFVTGRTMSLAMWIIDNTCLVYIYISSLVVWLRFSNFFFCCFSWLEKTLW